MVALPNIGCFLRLGDLLNEMASLQKKIQLNSAQSVVCRVWSTITLTVEPFFRLLHFGIPEKDSTWVRSLLSMRYMLLGYRIKSRPKNHALDRPCGCSHQKDFRWWLICEPSRISCLSAGVIVHVIEFSLKWILLIGDWYVNPIVQKRLQW